MNRPGGLGDAPRPTAPPPRPAPPPPMQPTRRAPEPEKSKLVPIVLGIVLLGGAGFGAMKFFGGSPAAESPTPAPPVHRQPVAAAASPSPLASASASPLASGSPTPLTSGSPTPDASATSAEMTEGDKLMAAATESLKSKDAAGAVASAQKAVDFFAKPGADAEKVTASQALLRKATIALADEKIVQAKKLVEDRKFRTAESTAKEAEELYGKFEGTEKGKEQALAVQEDARTQLNAARTLRASATPTPNQPPRPGTPGTPPDGVASPMPGMTPSPQPH